MPINTANLSRKLQAMKSKNVAAITAAHVYIPFLGNNYTEAQLQTWLNTRISQLEDIQAKNYTDQQLATLQNGLYGQLSNADKLIADKIIAGQPYDLSAASSAVAYDRLVGIVLYKFVTAT